MVGVGFLCFSIGCLSHGRVSDTGSDGEVSCFQEPKPVGLDVYGGWLVETHQVWSAVDVGARSKEASLVFLVSNNEAASKKR